MSIIITHSTDQRQAKYGYCSCCYEYHEVWRKDNTSICPRSNKKMYHIPSVILFPFLFIGFLASISTYPMIIMNVTFVAFVVFILRYIKR